MLRRGIILVIGVLVVSGITIFSIASAEEGLIPGWLKNTANYWVNDQISDSEFISALQYLVEQEILIIPEKETPEQIQAPLKMGFKEFSSKAYGFAFNYPEGWYEKIYDENCDYLVSEKPKGGGSSLCALTENKMPYQYGQELLDTIYEKRSDTCKNAAINDVLDYTCSKFTARKLDQITMDGTPAYLISYSENRVKGGVSNIHTFWEIYIPISFRTTLFTLETTERDFTEYDEIIDEIISSFRVVSKRQEVYSRFRNSAEIIKNLELLCTNILNKEKDHPRITDMILGEKEMLIFTGVFVGGCFAVLSILALLGIIPFSTGGGG